MSRAIPASALEAKDLHSTFLNALRNRGLPTPDRERRFAPPRRWMFDYSWPDAMVALEVEGGVWTRGRHTRGKGFIDDMAKYNAATLLGWRLVRCMPSTLCDSDTLDMLERLLSSQGNTAFEWNP